MTQSHHTEEETLSEYRIGDLFCIGQKMKLQCGLYTETLKIIKYYNSADFLQKFET